MPQNGEINQKFGVYKSLCCGAEIVIDSGVVFPECPNHRKRTTRWKPVQEDTVQGAATEKAVYDLPLHIENRRLFNLAAGRFKAEEWESRHLHECRVCQGVLYVFANQPISREDSPDPADAA